MASLFQDLKALKHKIGEVKNIMDTNYFPPFTSSFGLNTLLIMVPENAVLMVKRSGLLRNMNGKDQWHVSMNEALTVTDIDEGIIDFQRCVCRGLREELGIKPRDQSGITFNKFGDLFFSQEVFEMGLTNIVKIDMTFEEIKSRYSVAKDAELESVEIQMISMEPQKIREFISNNECTKACQYCLEMMLGRYSELC
jgi:hypothetical protein